MRRLKAKAAAAAAATAAAAASTTAAEPGPVTPSSKRGGTGGKKGAAGVQGRVVGREDAEPKLDKESQETVKREQEAQHALKAQLEELVGALKASSLMVHSTLREQNKVV